MIVDDDPQIRRVLRTALVAQGYEVVDARNGDEALEKLRDEKVDLVILDMKAFTLEQHKRVTGGVDNAQVIAFSRRLAALKRPMWFRYVLVPGLTDDPAEMKKVADFAASLGVVEHAEILPFHQMGRYKWEKLGLDYTLSTTASPSQAAVAIATDIFRAAGLNAT